MSLAFQTVLVLLLYLPGAFLVWSMTGGLSEDRDIPIPSATITTLVVLSVTAAVLLHLLGGGTVWLLGVASGGVLYSPATSVFTLLSVANDQPSYATAAALLGLNLGPMAVYLLALVAFAIGFGWTINKLIRVRGLEVRYRSLRFRPKWHYVFSAEFLQRRLGTEERVDVIVDAAVDLGGDTYIYSGIVADFWFDRQTSALETLVLNEVTRTPLSATGRPDGARNPTWIEGESLVLRFAEVKNLNIRYDQRPRELEPADLVELRDQLDNLGD